VALGVAVLGEPFTPEMAAAFALILGGSVLATRAGGRRAAADAEPEPAPEQEPEPACVSPPEPAPGRP
jgi:hypothetical protein